MGISYLTKHLLPYAETVLLGRQAGQDGPPRVQSVVIDGPSLVYHVYYRLLAWTDPTCDALDIQPSCDEVSQGVVSCLLQLNSLGVEIHKICFDGALPVSKRDTRLARIEKSRHRLELSRRRGVPPTQGHRIKPTIRPAQLWQSRSLPARWRNLPENPFMVSAVFEDLQDRWSKKRIVDEIQHGTHLLVEAEYPWANITTMVPGEADVECARVARLTGSVVLTNDSDLMVHDLGPHGAVVFLNSVHMLEDAPDLNEPEIRGLRIHPQELSRHLGVVSIQRFAYELTSNPQFGFTDLLRRSREDSGTIENSSSYHDFLREYQIDVGQPVAEDKWQARALDPRVSELFWQYDMPDVYCQAEQPHMYLGVIHEDHSRRCAWEQGRFYRAIGYSLLDLSHSARRRFPVVHEFVRRGGRIVAEQVTLSGAKTTASDLGCLQRRLDLAQSVFGNSAQPSFWVLFALSEIYRDTANTATAPTPVHLERFLEKGFMGKSTEWADIHLVAQIQALLYSLRILKQLLDITAGKEVAAQHHSILTDLPPLHLLMKSRHEIVQIFAVNNLVGHSVSQMFKTYH